ncbi:hypothetical protein HHUSO_G16962 [Huso huso]|uniref:Uncharacterized protein n=1 Tax=Huso huso TaxID=61971 RepID=A0ABR0Z7P4_HUSHU
MQPNLSEHPDAVFWLPGAVEALPSVLELSSQIENKPTLHRPVFMTTFNTEWRFCIFFPGVPRSLFIDMQEAHKSCLTAARLSS